jgi:hypothetical protein
VCDSKLTVATRSGRVRIPIECRHCGFPATATFACPRGTYPQEPQASETDTALCLLSVQADNVARRVCSASRHRWLPHASRVGLCVLPRRPMQPDAFSASTLRTAHRSPACTITCLAGSRQKREQQRCQRLHPHTDFCCMHRIRLLCNLLVPSRGSLQPRQQLRQLREERTKRTIQAAQATEPAAS